MSRHHVIAAALAATCLAAAPIASAETTHEAPDARIELTGGSFALGIGLDWARGTLAYEGREIPIDMHGVSIARIGAASFNASGEVYNLRDLSDFGGHYAAVSVGGGLLHGGSFMALRNDKGVVIRMSTLSGGLDIDFGVKGLSIALR